MSRAERRKKELLQAARSIVTEGGFRDLQMNAVAGAAGVAVGTIYSYFPSKAALCAELVALVSQRELDVLMEIARSGEAPESLLRTAVRTFAERAFRSGRLAYAVIAEPVDPEVEDARLRYRAEIGRAIQSILEAGVADGSFNCKDVDTASVCIVGAFMEGVIGGPCAAGVKVGKDEIEASLR
jgi:AcrR family transcriptional regulator